MPTNGLIAVMPVRPGAERNLRDRLNRIGNDVRGRRHRESQSEPFIDLPASRLLHFARLTLLADPERGPECRRLLLATDFDGTLEEHAAELYELTRLPEMIWGTCEGFAGRESFGEFLAGHRIDPQT